MEVSELITAIREDHLSDTFSGWESASQAERNDQFLWPDAALFRYITEAERQACNRTDFLYDDDTYAETLVDGDPSYNIDSKITRIEQIHFDGKTVRHMSKMEFQTAYPNWRTDKGIEGKDPVYTVRGRKLRLYPIPNATDANKLLTFEVYRLPIDPITSEADELEIPEEYHRDLIWWVLYEAYSKQDAEAYDPKRADRYLMQFNQAFGDYIPSEIRLNQLQEGSSNTVRGIDYLSSGSNQIDQDWPD